MTKDKTTSGTPTKVEVEEATCPACNGNNKDMPCAYPSEGRKGCLRDKEDMVLIPRIHTRCPACHRDTLTINDKHLLCTWYRCPNPTLIDRLTEPAMVLIPREPTAALLNIIARPIFPEDWDVGKEKQVQNLKAGLGLDQIPPVAEMESAYGQYKRLIEVVEDKPDLSKCPNCGGLADNGHDRCVPPNVYCCTKCSKSEED